MRGALASDLSLMLPSYLGSSVDRFPLPTARRFNRSPGSPNLSPAMKYTEPAHGARGVFHCIQAGQDPSARRCASRDRPAATSSRSRHTVYRDTHTEDRMTTTEPPTRRLRRREEPT